MPSNRAQVVARVEQALANAVARLEERELALTQQATIPKTDISLDFSKFEKHLSELANCTKPTSQQFDQIDASLRDGEDALRKWLAGAETIRRKLASGAGRAIG